MSNRLVYFVSPKSNVRHYSFLYLPKNSSAHVGQYCIPVCWIGHNHKLTLSKKNRLCKLCIRAFKTYEEPIPRLRESDFRVEGIDEKLCYETEQVWL